MTGNSAVALFHSPLPNSSLEFIGHTFKSSQIMTILPTIALVSPSILVYIYIYFALLRTLEDIQ